MWVEFGVGLRLSMSRRTTSGQTALETTLKSPADPSGPGWRWGRGHKNNPPPPHTNMFTLSDIFIFLNSVFAQQNATFSVNVSVSCAHGFLPSEDQIINQIMCGVGFVQQNKLSLSKIFLCFCGKKHNKDLKDLI